MSLQTVLAEIEPGWYAAGDEADVDAKLIAQARGSRLGERVLARWLASTHAAALLAPTPQREIAGVVGRWPRERLDRWIRDLGVLAYAPAIRSEIGRDAVRRLKQALGNSYLLALDRSVWDGRLPAEQIQAMAAELGLALAADPAGYDALYALLAQQGRAELQAWTATQDPALGEWSRLLRAREPERAAVLPAKQAQFLHEHHLGRAREA